MRSYSGSSGAGSPGDVGGTGAGVRRGGAALLVPLRKNIFRILNKRQKCTRHIFHKTGYCKTAMIGGTAGT